MIVEHVTGMIEITDIGKETAVHDPVQRVVTIVGDIVIVTEKTIEGGTIIVPLKRGATITREDIDTTYPQSSYYGRAPFFGK